MTVSKASRKLPRHVAIIMDGNGRWAQKRGLPRSAGHVAGVRAVRRVVKSCVDRGIECLTLFAFSSENWSRPSDEVTALMRLFMVVLDREVAKLHRNGIRLCIIGDTARFSPELQERISRAENLTAANTRMTLCVAANYGARWDITRSVQRLLSINPCIENFTPEQIAEGLSTAEFPELDLLIRTGGEQRVSNFLLWQAAHAQLYFTEVWWPDFDDRAMAGALSVFESESWCDDPSVAAPVSAVT